MLDFGVEVDVKSVFDGTDDFLLQGDDFLWCGLPSAVDKDKRLLFIDSDIAFCMTIPTDLQNACRNGSIIASLLILQSVPLKYNHHSSVVSRISDLTIVDIFLCRKTNQVLSLPLFAGHLPKA